LKFEPDDTKKLFNGRITTDREFGDFIFRFDFRLQPEAKNGVLIRGQVIQLDDDNSPLKVPVPTGSIMGKMQAKRGYTRPAGEWNSQEIMIKKHEWTVTVNEEVVLHVDIAKLAKLKDVLKHTSSPLGSRPTAAGSSFVICECWS
jgi:hypothetical protein